MKIVKHKDNNNLILGLLGLILFFLVVAVIYLVILVSQNTSFKEYQAFMPLIVFSGFFIFLIGAILLALSIFRVVGGFR